MIRYNIDLIRKALKELDKTRPYAFKKTDKDELIEGIICLQNLVRRYENNQMAVNCHMAPNPADINQADIPFDELVENEVKPAGSGDYGCIIPGEVTEIDMSEENELSDAERRTIPFDNF